MNKSSTQQEILLVTTTTFCKGQLCTMDEVEPDSRAPEPDQLEAACWKGILNRLLPEIMEKPHSGKMLYPWHIRQGSSFLQIELSEFPLRMEKMASINSAYFLPGACKN